MRNITLLSTVAMLPVAMSLAVTPAAAQTMNYGSLEAMFGEPVTTSATGTPQKATDAPANMQIVSADEIRRSGSVSIPEILRFYAGVDVRGNGTGGSDVALRGYNQGFNPRLLVLINGRQVYNDDYGYVAWEALPVQLDEIRQIEIVKGPASALFGFNAVSGVINIITYDPLLDSTNVVTARGGTNGYLGGDGVATVHAGDKFGLRLTVGGYRADETANSTQAAALGPYRADPYQHTFGADARYKVTASSELSAEVTASDSSNTGLTSEGALDSTKTYRTNSAKLGYAADTDLGLINLTAYRNEVRSSLLQSAASNLDFREDVYVVQANDVFRIGTDNVFRIGAEFRNNYVGGAGLFASSLGYDDYAGSVMWNRQLGPQWNWTNALRIDHLELSRSKPTVNFSPFSQADYNNGSITEPSFNSGLVYKPTDDDTVRLLVGRGIQAPSLIDYGLQIGIATSPFTHLILSGNPNLNAVRVSNYEVDYDRSIAAINGVLRTAFYYQKNENLLALATQAPVIFQAGGNILQESSNIGSSDAYGGEIGLSGTSASGIRWTLAYSLIHVKDHLTIKSAAVGGSPWDFEKASPNSAVDAGVGYNWNKFEFDLRAKWQSSFTDYYGNAPVLATNYPSVTVKSYVTANARVGYAVTDKIVLAASGQQLNDQSIHQSLGLPVERRGVFSATIRY